MPRHIADGSQRKNGSRMTATIEAHVTAAAIHRDRSRYQTPTKKTGTMAIIVNRPAARTPSTTAAGAQRWLTIRTASSGSSGQYAGVWPTAAKRRRSGLKTSVGSRRSHATTGAHRAL